MFFFLQSVLKDLWKAAKLVSCKGKKYLEKKSIKFKILHFAQGWMIGFLASTIWCGILLAAARVINFNCNLKGIKLQSSSLGDPELLREKLLSIPGHISNQHSFPANKKYQSCPHPPPTGERSKAWLHPNSLVCKAIVVKNMPLFLCYLGCKEG